MVTTRFGENAVPVERVDVSAYTIPTDFPESDGTLKWDSTTLVLVQITAGGKRSVGYTYADVATATLINDLLVPIVKGRDVMSIPEIWYDMVYAIRNLGRPGICSMAIAGVDNSLWDLKARLLDLPLVTLLGQKRKGAVVYGSGGFTSYSRAQLQRQLGDWVASGINSVKMKVGRHPNDDPSRVADARAAIGPDVELFVDANGAYSRKEALAMAKIFARESAVTWFQEPVDHHDLDGLNLIRDRGPAGMDIVAGEYGYDLWYFRHMLEANAVDVLLADATRCAGITGFMRVDPLVESRFLKLSAHTAPSIHVHPCCAINSYRNLEYFHDHVRIEHMLFDGALTPVDGALYPDLSRPGLGLEFKQADAEKYKVAG